ncbi:MAG: hypothetical protein J0M34_03680 [Alphaproteobacteria bacterium]|nr:hypothetical protein [Alphaproteobacteria bacterium]
MSRNDNSNSNGRFVATHASVVGAISNFWIDALSTQTRLATSMMRAGADAVQSYNRSVREASEVYWELATKIAVNTNAHFLLQWMKNAEEVRELWNIDWTRESVAAMNERYPEFMQFRKMIDRQFQSWDYSPANSAYAMSREAMLAYFRFLPPPVATWMKHELMNNPQIQDIAHSKGMIEAMEIVGRTLPGQGEIFESDLNHHFVTENADGEIVPVDDMKLIDDMFPRATNGNGQAFFPRIILTSSHARAEKNSDITDITHGVQALARDSIGKGKQELDIAHLGDGGSLDSSKTLVLMACDTEQNPFLNGAMLLRRLEELQSIKHTGELPEDNFEYTSDGAKRIAKLMLRCMAQDPDDVDMNDLRPLKEIGEPIQLRARPELIAQHFQLIGYSKGGNVVSDAMRYLIHDLMAQSGGEYLVQMNGHALSEPEHKEKVRDLVRNVACMSIAALEVQMDKYYKECGVRRASFNNENDMISGHMPFDSTWADRKWTIKGTKEKAGHDPKDALGTIHPPKRGYVLDDAQVRRRVSEAMAPLYGKAAMSSISYTDEQSRADGAIVVGTAAGTSDELFINYQEKIEDALRKAFVKARFSQEDADKVQLLIPEVANRRAFVLQGPEGWRDDPKALQALYNGLAQLRKEPNSGLVVSDEIFETIIPKRIAHMQTPERLDKLASPALRTAWENFELDTTQFRQKS